MQLHQQRQQQNERITILAEKENNLRNQYDNKVLAVLKKGQFTDAVKNELKIMAAEQFGIEEQLYNLRHNNTDNRRRDFINNFNELVDFNNEHIEHMYNNDENDDLLIKKYNITEKPKAIQDVFKKNNRKFIKILKQFIDKRNVYRSNENVALLEELVLLKCNLIKHLCVMEKLCK
ncbi:protein kinase-interacting protein 1 [Spodoptera frugiperda multiple nucleopolyhedrovirus]|uniref:PKIP-1 n=1 Tax=Spodoptera frugiperda nuclear polyhedrosis virus TaxID=10455 RepID=A1YJ21_NPVSF|nr:protein kinase-interacting protein 1 [Spodoptera frugiperda multiple nucleopolyhedrovirus]ABM45741.1 protein kinase-interacting protein 1 [Spodoptera frugiperda multiple nucleopolyhedrovirus]ACA02588.1 PKIP-1 [Spodoptera frugiperda multiple nucleopolyhedrovirus]ADV91262.1 pkip-1 [Spodoptera frugiperda multiple nucleopolyhedrovirus]AFH58961.1 pkip-1 [Spodoptera frugiperda multiple nucleopolyhedrovirus]AIW01442.1 PKIP-1 protein [Spodoptera frugiperda multiple nucleopolyhedrovirus]